ncbi:hypothetical protein [Sphingopyxis alaskensis]|uniref:hypothetical protein n=1 Tax=Sphingopyxis alaskensis TaxID=117207 RepID=UPI00391CF7BE
MESLPIDVVIHLARYRIYEAVAVHGHDRIDAEYLAEEIGHGVTSSFVKMALRQLKELREVELEGDATPVLNIMSAKFRATLTAFGARSVEKDLNDASSVISRYLENGIEGVARNLIPVGALPPPDRLVEPTDNQEAYDQSVESLRELEDALSKSNEAGDALGDDRRIALEEVSALAKMISQAQVRAQPVLLFARRSLGWIIEKAGAASVGEIAKRALNALIDWLTS